MPRVYALRHHGPDWGTLPRDWLARADYKPARTIVPLNGVRHSTPSSDARTCSDPIPLGVFVCLSAWRIRRPSRRTPDRGGGLTSGAWTPRSRTASPCGRHQQQEGQNRLLDLTLVNPRASANFEKEGKKPGFTRDGRRSRNGTPTLPLLLCATAHALLAHSALSLPARGDVHGGCPSTPRRRGGGSLIGAGASATSAEQSQESGDRGAPTQAP